MKFGLCLPTFRYGAEPTLEHITVIACRAEELGYDSVWVGDHVLVPSDQTRMRFFTDPLITLAYVAGFTERIVLGTSIVVAPLRNPLVLAKQAATLDFLSRGRLVLGLGGGWLEREFRYLSADFEGRGRRFDETLQILRTVWRDCPASFDGEFYSFDDAVLEPRPVQPGGPPLWIGGSSARAFRRVAELGDAWHADDTPADDVARAGEAIRSLATSLGRMPEVTTRVTVRIPSGGKSDASREGYYRGEEGWSGIEGSGDDLRAQVDEFRSAGSAHFIAQFEHNSIEEHLACLESFAADVIRPIHERSSETTAEGASA
jgi:probable F420-dependent oxidoreductase